MRSWLVASLSLILVAACGADDKSATGEQGGDVDPADTRGDAITADGGLDAVDDAALGDGSGAGDAAADVAVDTGPPPVEVELEFSAALEGRRAEYLAYCSGQSAPDERGGLYGQSCRVFSAAETLDDAALDSAITELEQRNDTADFDANGLVRLLYLDNETGALGDERRGAIEGALLAFRYWLTEPGDDGMAFWTENHQILFHTVELLVGQRFPDQVFGNDGRTGAEHVEHARERIVRWLELRGRYGFSEWHSNVYLNEDVPALLNLYDFAEDDEIRRLAAIVLDIVALDLLHHTFDGVLVTTHGRTYESKFIDGLNDSTREFAWITLGLGDYASPNNFAGAFMATSTWAPPALIEEVAAAVAERSEHRQRDSFDLEEGSGLGISYTGVDDIVVWAGLSAIVAPETIDGSVEVLEAYDLWDGFLFGDLPDSLVNVLRALRGTPSLRRLARSLAPLSQGMALEAIDTYTWRTPYYQLSGAQDYKPGDWSAQTTLWRAALSPAAWVFTSAPALVGAVGAVDDITIDEAWIGGWQPRVTLYRNVGVIQYRRLDMDPAVDSIVSGDYLHAYFPREAFDEVVEDNGWTFGRLGDAWVALWSQLPYTWSESNTFEQRVDALDNVWIVELGSVEDGGTFESFVDDRIASAVAVGADRVVRYDSPGVGAVEVGWEGAMTVDGEEVDTGPYERFDHETTRQVRGEGRIDVELANRLVVLDVDARTRREYTLGAAE